MEAQFEITAQDMTDFSKYHYFKAPAGKRRFLSSAIVAIVIPLLALALAATSGNFWATVSAFLPLIIGPPLYVGFLMGLRQILIPLRLKKMMAQGKNRTVFGPRKMILSSQNVSDIGEYAQYTCDWRAVEKIAIGPKALYIYITAMSALIVPKRAFSSEAAFQTFAETAQTYLSNVSEPAPLPIALP